MGKDEKAAPTFKLSVGRTVKGKIAFSAREPLALDQAVEDGRKAMAGGAREVIITVSKK